MLDDLGRSSVGTCMGSTRFVQWTDGCTCLQWHSLNKSTDFSLYCRSIKAKKIDEIARRMIHNLRSSV